MEDDPGGLRLYWEGRRLDLWGTFSEGWMVGMCGERSSCVGKSLSFLIRILPQKRRKRGLGEACVNQALPHFPRFLLSRPCEVFLFLPGWWE